LNRFGIYDKIDFAELIPYRGVAQLEEHRSPKPRVAGSSPVSPAIKNKVKPEFYAPVFLIISSDYAAMLLTFRIFIIFFGNSKQGLFFPLSLLG
jgi:hypothetical protein